MVTDKGSRAQHARVSISGVPANRVIDTGADITIIGDELFAWVAAAAHCVRKTSANQTRHHARMSKNRFILMVASIWTSRLMRRL